MVNQLVFASPDKRHQAVLSSLGEIHSGANGYALSIDRDPHSFVNRVFGEVCLWSPASRFLSVQEWKATGTLEAPWSCLLLVIDVLARRECLIASVEGGKGNILPEGFIGESLMYTVIYYGQFGATKSLESEFQYLDGWQAIR